MSLSSGDVSISSLKAQLQKLGISTTTVGLVGDDRYEELLRRLTAVVGEQGSSSNAIDDTPDSMSESLLSTLSIADIKNRLAAIGEVGLTSL